MFNAEVTGMMTNIVIIGLVLVSLFAGFMLLPDNVKEFFEML